MSYACDRLSNVVVMICFHFLRYQYLYSSTWLVIDTSTTAVPPTPPVPVLPVPSTAQYPVPVRSTSIGTSGHYFLQQSEVLKK